jgi:hypothetical protein
VQVGVYRSTGTPALLKQLSPLSADKTASGATRFTSGVFKDQSSAEAARKEISRLVPDAFVIAYRDGKVISADEGSRLVNNGEFKPSSQDTPVKVVPPVETKSEPVVKEETSTPQPASPAQNAEPAQTKPSRFSPGLPDDGKVVYRVQIGAFKGVVPFDLVTKYMRIRDFGVISSRNSEGLNVFYAGVTDDFETAGKIQQAALSVGITDAFVVAFRGRTQITVEEAKTLLGK